MFENINDINLIFALMLAVFPILSFIFGRYSSKIKEDTTLINKIDEILRDNKETKKDMKKIEYNLSSINEKIADVDKRVMKLEIKEEIEKEKIGGKIK